MVNRNVFILTIGILILLLGLLSACAGPRISKPTYEVVTEEKSGVVRDIDTGEPVENAYVIATWREHLGYSSWSCRHITHTMSDKDGRFHIPKQKYMSYRSEPMSLDSIAPLKIGYNDTNVPQRFSQSSNINKVDIFTRRQGGDKGKALEYLLAWASSINGCVRSVDQSMEFYPIVRELYYEAVRLSGGESRPDMPVSNIAVMAGDMYLAFHPELGKESSLQLTYTQLTDLLRDNP